MTKDLKAKSEMIAQIAHSAVKKYNELKNEYSLLHWDDMSDLERESWVDTVRERLTTHRIVYPAYVVNYEAKGLFLKIVNHFE